MDINFDCPRCGQNISIDEQGAGEKVECPTCKWQITVPSKPIKVPEKPTVKPPPFVPSPPITTRPVPAPSVAPFVERRSGWSVFLRLTGVACILIGVGGCGLSIDKGGAAETGGFIWLAGCVGAAIQCFFFAFMVNVFTDIRWFVKQLADVQTVNMLSRSASERKAEGGSPQG